ncbi:MAG: ABC transporter ATP-binding protein [Caldisericaceae bacterium]
MEKYIEMLNIKKTFLSMVALKNVNFTVNKGEIVTLLGENGAGKTTLMKILYGMYSKDSGEIFVEGKRVEINAPKDAIKLGIGMVHQHFTLVNTLTVLENVILGLPSQKPFMLDLKSHRERLLQISKGYGLEVNPDALIWQLSVGERQRVEIIKALYRNANVLILDEPTAVLTPQESEDLFNTLNLLKREGKSVVFISHKMEEVMEISDRIVILRNGVVTGERKKEETNRLELARLMVGKDVIDALRGEKCEAGNAIFKVSSLSAFNDKGIVALNDVSFDIRKGEIVGLAGVSGNGQKELEDIICGVRKAEKGNIYIDGEDITGKTPKELIQLGIGRIPEDRMEDGLILDAPLLENLVIEYYDKQPISKGMLIDYRQMEALASKLVVEYNIKASSVYDLTRTLSGGNLQKVILARVLSRDPKMIVASQPTRGLDVGATEYIHEKLLQAKSDGAAVLLISEDLNEILHLSDRIMVIYEGRIMGIIDRECENVSVEKIGLMMAGSAKLEVENESN